MRNQAVGFLFSLVMLLLPRAWSATEDSSVGFVLSQGDPLTDEEYKHFFTMLTPSWKAESICKHRITYGCQNPSLLQLDEYENNGYVPEGTVCSNIPYAPTFESFCQFTHFRCANRIYYAKRIQCSSSVSSTFKKANFTTKDTTTTVVSTSTTASTSATASTITEEQAFQSRMALIYKNRKTERDHITTDVSSVHWKQMGCSQTHNSETSQQMRLFPEVTLWSVPMKIPISNLLRTPFPACTMKAE